MKKKAFISYSHRDNTENFVGRLAYALDMYIEAFWDHKLQIGSWEPQLMRAIEECDYFLVVMSAHQKTGSKWCRKEIKQALKLNKNIIPIRRFANHSHPYLEERQLVDFTISFDHGFKQLTNHMLGEEKTSWEYLYDEPDSRIYMELGQGRLPGIISQSIIEYMIVEYLWKAFSDTHIATSIRPRTARDVVDAIDYVRKKEIDNGNVFETRSIDNFKTLIETILGRLSNLSETQHQENGELAIEVYSETIKILEDQIVRHADVFGIRELRETYQFNITTKIRELIKHYSRQSRYLY